MKSCFGTGAGPMGGGGRVVAGLPHLGSDASTLGCYWVPGGRVDHHVESVHFSVSAGEVSRGSAVVAWLDEACFVGGDDGCTRSRQRSLSKMLPM